MILVIIQLKSKCYDDSNKLIIGKMKDETGGVAIEAKNVFILSRQ